MRKVTWTERWGITLAAILDMIVLVLIAVSNPTLELILMFAACEVVLCLFAIATWKKYFEQLIDEKIEQRLATPAARQDAVGSRTGAVQ